MRNMRLELLGQHQSQSRIQRKMKDKCYAALFRELCELKAGLRRAVIVPASWIEGVRQIIRALDLRPAPLFFRIPYDPKPVDVVILSTDYKFIGEFGAKILYEGTVEEGGDLVLGEVCGYPKCCISAFSDSTQIDRACDRYMKQCKELGRDPYDLWLYEDREGWVWVFSSKHISHIPCSPLCMETEKLAQRIKDLCEGCKDKMCQL